MSLQVSKTATLSSRSLVEFFEEESGLSVGDNDICVCGASDVSIRQAMKSRDKGEPYQK